MVQLAELVAFLDRELRIAEIPDYPGALNGLQVANATGEVGRVIAAVDATLPVIEEAAAVGPSLLIVHHGMFWQGAQPVTGPLFRKLRTAMDAGLAIYSAHLPLDVHSEWGNNIRLAREIGMIEPKPFFDWKGIFLGLRGGWNGTREELADIVARAVGGPVHTAPGGPAEIHEIGLITGGAGTQIAEVAAAGINTFITGEGPHWSHTFALENGVNLLLAGHYATETLGVRTLAEELARRYAIEWSFIDHPTGL